MEPDLSRLTAATTRTSTTTTPSLVALSSSSPPSCSSSSHSHSHRATQSPPLMSAPLTPAGSAIAPVATTTNNNNNNNNNGVSNKPKQSKSRNGCATCKAKRLKCDETKPTCRQCEKRNVVCGGYQKDFKWRSFGKESFSPKPPTKGRKSATAAAAAAPVAAAASVHKLPTPPTEPTASEGSVISAEDAVAQLSDPCSPAPELQPSVPRGVVSDKDEQLERTPSTKGVMPGCEETSGDAADAGVDHASSLIDDWLSVNSQTFYKPTTTLDEVSPSAAYSLPFFSSDGDKNNNVGEVRRDGSPENGDLWFNRNAAPISRAAGRNDEFDMSNPGESRFSSRSSETLLRRFDRHTCGILSVKDGISENPWRTLIWPLATDAPALYHAICSLAAFHCSKNEPCLKVDGVDHMRQSVRALARNIRTMRVDAALATTLALAFAETWDKQVSSGVQHLRGAKALLSQALSYQQHNSLQPTDLARLRFLYKTWVYTSVIARLTSVDDVGHDDFSQSLLMGPSPQVHEVDPLMGCATTLFPLIGRVASLVQKVRTTATNSIAVISKAIELKTLVEQWEPPKYFEPPKDPTSDVQHSFQTAQAYRWATLLHLHQAVPEIPSQTATDLARRVLVLLATVPLGSRATVVHLYPLLAASCEVESDEDRNWVLERWETMQSRLMVGNVDRCLELIREVWARRDEYALENATAPFAMPVDDVTKRRSAVDGCGDGMYMRTQEDWSSGLCDCHDDTPRRRFSESNVDDYLGFRPSQSLSAPMVPQKKLSFSSGLEDVDYEKTVRGSLHWAGVMRDWNWQGMLST